MFLIETLKILPYADQIDEQGHLRPFFPRPPREGHGGGRGGHRGRHRGARGAGPARRRDLYPPILPGEPLGHGNPNVFNFPSFAYLIRVPIHAFPLRPLPGLPIVITRNAAEIPPRAPPLALTEISG